MKKYRFIILAFAAVLSLTACDDQFVNMETSGYTGTPATVAASAITSESLPGAIKLKWATPAAEAYDYMKISYVNPANQETVTQIVSNKTDSVLISNTLAKYGAYHFSFQAFNADHQGGEVVTVDAKSGKALATYTVNTKKIELAADQLSTDNQEPSEGPIKNLIDGNYNSFFHTRWSSPQKPMPQYIQIDFKEAHTNFAFWYRNRNGSQVGPQVLDVQISTDGNTWETLETLDAGLPSGSQAEYTSKAFQPSHPFTHLRLLVTKTYGDKKYFNLAELQVFDAEIIVNDPEA